MTRFAPPPSNLRLPLSSFLGRELEVAELKRMSRRSRLLTLVGAAGVGKTRLAIELARQVAPNHPGGVHFADLSPLGREASVVAAVADLLGVAPERGDPLQTLLAALRSAELLLVLDNCEHVIDAVARFCEAALSTTSSLHIVTTTREALGVPGEARWQVQPLAFPALGTTSLRSIERSPAVRLFVARAALVNAEFSLGGRNAQTVAAISRRVEGIPLALELCAARIGMMPPEEILARLDERYELLTEGSRTAVERQRTLRGTVDWSYELLSDAERALFRRLAVFRGTFDAAAIESVTRGGAVPANVLPVLTRLVDKSMVVPASAVGERGRYRLLETLREYAAERLDENQETEAVRAAHCRHFVEEVERGHPHTTALAPDQFGDGRSSSSEVAWLTRVAADEDNLRAALEWSLLRDPPAFARLAAGSINLWSLRGHHGEARRWLAAALEVERDETLLRARLLRSAGLLAWRKGDFKDARARLEESLAIQRKLGSRAAVGDTLGALGFVLFGGDDFSEAAELFAEQLAIARETSNRSLLITALQDQAILAMHLGDLSRAEAHLDEALPLARASNTVLALGAGLGLLGRIKVHQGDFKAARELLEESLRWRHQTGDRLGLAGTIDYLSEWAGSQSLFERALILAGISDRLYAEAGGQAATLPAASRISWLAPARRRLGPRADRLRRQGAALGDAEALAFARSGRESLPFVDGETSLDLTRREREVADLVSAGLTNRQAAERLNLSIRTVDAHLEHIRNKLGLNSRAQIAVWWLQHAAASTRAADPSDSAS